MKRKIPATDSLVLFRNCQDMKARGTLLHLNPHSAVFEVYNPYSVVQLSEILQDLRICRGERKIYNGRAVVSNLVHTGLMTIVSANLMDPWSELSDLLPGQGLRDEVARRIQEWEAGQKIRPSFQLTVDRLRSFQSEVSRLLEQVDVAIGADGRNGWTDLEREWVGELEEPISPKMTELFERFEYEAGRIPPDEVASHKAFAQRELHPLLLCSPFIHRSYSKPLGYAGDYGMVNMVLRNPWEGPTAYARMVNSFILKNETAYAHQHRIRMLFKRLSAECRRVSQEDRTFRVLNVGCGPAVEVQRFIRDDPLSELAEFHLLDFNEETIAYAKREVQKAMTESRRKPVATFHQKSIHRLLREAGKGHIPNGETYDMVYCAGLFDYLTDRTCRRLLGLFHAWTRPGGLIVATNVHPDNPILYIMEYLLDWHLIYRDEKHMAKLASFLGNGRLCKDETGLNVFLDIRKKEVVQ